MWEELIKNSFWIDLLAAMAEIAVGFFFGSFVKNIILKFQNARGTLVDQGVLTFTGSAINISIRIIAIVIALAQIGVNMSVVVGAVSALGLGVSLALRENMANVASGIQILMTKPFRIGDYIQNEEFEGTVKTIEIMFTTLETFDLQEVVIPNAQLISTPIVNYSVSPSRRVAFIVPISRTCSYDQIQNEIQTMLENEAGVLKDPKPMTVVADYSTNGKSLMIRIICFAKQEDYWTVLASVRNRVEQIAQNHEDALPKENIKVLS